MHNDFSKIQTDIERLREEVLSRVRTVRRIKAFVASPASSAILSIVFIACAGFFVSFVDVVHNIMLHGEWGGRFSYTYSSVMHAQMVVQILAFLTFISFLILFGKILFRLRTPVFFLGNFFSRRSPLRFFRS